MDGGTAFHFVTGRIHEARERAMDAAKGLDVLVGVVVAAVHQQLRAPA